MKTVKHYVMSILFDRRKSQDLRDNPPDSRETPVVKILDQKHAFSTRYWVVNKKVTFNFFKDQVYRTSLRSQSFYSQFF